MYVYVYKKLTFFRLTLYLNNLIKKYFLLPKWIILNFYDIICNNFINIILMSLIKL